jgi:hypothetical protein
MLGPDKATGRIQMFKRTFIVALLALGLMLGAAQAGPINSSNGTTSWTALVNLSYGSFTAVAGATGTAVTITPDTGVWNGTPPAWISYAATGYGDAILAPTYNNPATPIVSFTRTFTGSAGSILDMKLWADDTAFMRVDGGAWVPATHVWGQSTCETNPTSCTAPLFSEGFFTLGFTGDHTLEIQAYQIGTGTPITNGEFFGTTTSNPFGIQYDGTVPDGGTTLMLLGGALVGLGFLRRKFRA